MSDPSPVVDADEIRRILEARAAELARAPQNDEDPGAQVSLLVVVLGVERYGIDIDRVREIGPLARLTPLPATPPFWLGLVNLRGSLYPVLDLRRYLGHQVELDDGGAQIVVVGDEQMTVALKVDEVAAVRTVSRSAIGPPLAETSSSRAQVHAGLTSDLLAVLDVEALLADPALAVRDED